MARCLIIGCGCRGRLLAKELIAGGHAVRATTRDAGRAAELLTLGVEAVVGDPDRIATIAPALEHVTVACVLLGSATGTPEAIQALHGPRLAMLLTRMLDSTVHGVVYEAAGSVDPEVLDGGAEIVRRTCEGSRIPYGLIESDPAQPHAWAEAAVAAVDSVLNMRSDDG